MAHIKQFEHLKIQLEAIKSATNHFADDNCIGKGGFGKVYKGEIIDSKGQKTMVALKRLDRMFGQGDPEFWKEIMMLSFYRHENIVSLLGYCDDSGEKILMYEYAAKKSLECYLDKGDLTWIRRLKICIGAARGLAYLHTPVDTQLRIVHRDIKSSNILLDNNWNAKISDFGLSKFAPANKQFTFLVSNAVGTVGYCDPLYVETGLLTKESDVYSFGVVLFEVLCGRLCIDYKDKGLPLMGLAREYYEQNKISDLIYSNIKDEINPNSLKVFTKIAYQCLKRTREERPLMIEVVGALETALRYQGLHGGCEEMHIVGILKVKVIRTMNLKRRYFFTASSPFVVLKLTESSFPCAKKTTVKHNKNMNVEWNEELTLYVENFETQHLHMWVHDMVSVEKHDYVGRALLSLKNLSTFEYPEIHNLFITNENYSNLIIGDLIVEVVYKRFADDQIPVDHIQDVCSLMQTAQVGTTHGGGLLVVIIHEAISLLGQNHTNPSVSLLFRGESRKTTVCFYIVAPLVVKSLQEYASYLFTNLFYIYFVLIWILQTLMNNNFPVWEEEFTFMLEQPPTNETLHLEVISTPWMRLIHREESLGFVDIKLADVVNNKWIIKTYSLQHGDSRLNVELQWRTSNYI